MRMRANAPRRSALPGARFSVTDCGRAVYSAAMLFAGLLWADILEMRFE